MSKVRIRGHGGRKIGCTIAMLLASAAAPIVTHAAWQSQSLDLGYDVSAVQVDAKRNVIYVSAPLSNRVFVVDPVTLTVLRKIYVGFHPAGIELGSDGHSLYAALSGAGAVGVFDLDTDQQSEIDVSVLLDSSATIAVTEARPGLLFVSADQGNLVRIDLATLDASLAPSPYMTSLLGKDPTGNVLYVPDISGELNKLDITQAAAPIIYRSPQYLYGLNVSIDVSPTGDRLVLGSGEVLRANELTENGSVGAGVALFSADGTQIISAFGEDPIVLNRFDGTTLDRIESVSTNCSFSSPTQGLPSYPPKAIRRLPNNYGWAILGDTTLCLVHLPDELFGDGFE